MKNKSDGYFENVKSHMTSNEIAQYDDGKITIRKINEFTLGSTFVRYALCLPETLETIRIFDLDYSDTVKWRKFANKLLGYIKLRII